MLSEAPAGRESRRLAANVAKLPELLSKRQRLAAWSIEEFRHK